MDPQSAKAGLRTSWQTVPRSSRMKLPLWSESLIDGRSRSSVTDIVFGLLHSAGILGSGNIHVPIDVPLLSKLLHSIANLRGVCAAFTSVEPLSSLLPSYVFPQFFQETNYSTALFFCHSWSKELRGAGDGQQAEQHTQTTAFCLPLTNWQRILPGLKLFSPSSHAMNSLESPH